MAETLELAVEVVEWRYRQLLEAGYPALTAIRLAEKSEIDLHEAVDLLKNGCQVQLAIRILL